MRSTWRGFAVPLAAVALALTAACGSTTSTELVQPREAGAPAPYSGSLDIPVTEPDSENPLERSGAAGQALECAGAVATGGLYEEGLDDRFSSPSEALQAFLEAGIGPVPHQGYRVEVERATRALLSYDVDGRTHAAVVVVKDETPRDPELLWGVETFAACDPAEFAPSADDDFPFRVWSNRDGQRVPTTEISSSFGAEHCGWQTVTFLSLGRRQFVADPEGALRNLEIKMQTSYRADTVLPPDAVDTGYRLDDQALWKDASGDSVYLVSDDGIQRWPALEEPLYCK